MQRCLKFSVGNYCVLFVLLWGVSFFDCVFLGAGGGNDIQWCFSQVKGAVDDDVAEGKSNVFY